MAGKTWTSLTQSVFLSSWLGRYIEAGATGSYTKFWVAFFGAWFKVNPARLAILPNLDDEDDSSEECSDGEASIEPPTPNAKKGSTKKEKRLALIIHLRGLTTAERHAWQVKQGYIQDRKVRAGLSYLRDGIDVLLQRGKTWFRWRATSLATDRKSKAGLQTGKILKKFLHTKETNRVHSATHKYSKLYYDTRVASLVADETNLLDEKPSSAERLAIIKRLTQETWDNEDSETIAEVNAALDADRAAKQTAGSDGAERTAEEYQRYISFYPTFLHAS